MNKMKLSISVDAALVERMDRKAKRLGVNRSQFIERCCEDAMKAALPGRLGVSAEHLLIFRGHVERLSMALHALHYHRSEYDENACKAGWIELRVELKDGGSAIYTDYQERPL